MKKLLLFFLFLPSYVIACDCEQPLVALDFVRSEFVFWGTVVDKEYARDSQTYTVTFDVERHFKYNEIQPKTLKFTEQSEGEITGYGTSCDYSVSKGEKWLIYAYKYNDELFFGYPCSNSNRYNQLSDVNAEELEILENGNKIDLQKIDFSYTVIGGLSREFERATSENSINSLLAQLNPGYYRFEDDPFFESVAIRVDSTGILTDVMITDWMLVETKKLYGIPIYEYGKQSEPLSKVQEDILFNLKQSKKWQPARFSGVNVNSWVYLKVRIEKGKKPYATNY
ncbi:hypothetical protein [Pontibacter fetidus]|uniref:Tissue inhibitor of metalloproteinase n=1 Tax=Pontibacter fetidus TaxID=2700082 RepID=A0A6B2H9Z4_9BACT|nr:hypothetical protein [Pontibacter fetidus]NDK57627.1 hypothetical protein [Pontibacter fetidus]